jgi:formyl-CoA transferase
VLGAPELARHPDYADAVPRLANRERLQADLERLLSVGTAAEWTRRIRAAGIPCGPINTIDQTFADPQVQALAAVTHIDGIRLLRGPLWADDLPNPVYAPPPGLGAHTVEVLTTCGLTEDEIHDLRARQIVREQESAP